MGNNKSSTAKPNHGISGKHLERPTDGHSELEQPSSVAAAAVDSPDKNGQCQERPIVGQYEKSETEQTSASTVADSIDAIGQYLEHPGKGEYEKSELLQLSIVTVADGLNKNGQYLERPIVGQYEKSELQQGHYREPSPLRVSTRSPKESHLLLLQ